MPSSKKQSLRREIGLLRDQISKESRKRKSYDITRQFLSLPEYGQGTTVFTYVGYRSEVDTISIITALIAEGKKVCIPLTNVKHKSMQAVRITDISKDLVPGFKGIPEPHPSLLPAGAVDHESIAIVVVPGLVFDNKGGRLGYGGGFYDRFLSSQAPDALRVGLAFDIQVKPAVPTDEHDIAMDVILTETRILRTDAR